MKWRKAGVMCLSAVLGISALAGCGGESEKGGQETSDGKVNLKYYIWSDGENYTREIVDNYNNSQDKVNVELISLPNETYDNKLKVMLSGGSDADIVNLRSLNLVTQFQTAGALSDITDMVKDSDLDVSKYGSIWDSCYPDGKVSALPMRTSCWILFYNKDLLEEAGLTMPEQLTWEEYGEMAKQLTSGDGTQYGGCWVDWNIYQAIGTQAGTYLNDDDLTNVQTGIEYLHKFIVEDQSHVPLAEVKANDSQYLTDFENGRVAMLPQGEWLFNMLLTDIKDGKTDVNWDVAPLPVPEGTEPGTTWGAIQFAGIPKDSKHQEEAYDFLQYLCGDGGAGVMPEFGILPAYSSESGEEAFNEAVGNENATKVVFSAKKMPEAPAYDKYSDLITAFTENAELYLYGEKGIDETMANFEKQREDIMSK